MWHAQAPAQAGGGGAGVMNAQLHRTAALRFALPRTCAATDQLGALLRSSADTRINSEMRCPRFRAASVSTSFSYGVNRTLTWAVRFPRSGGRSPSSIMVTTAPSKALRVALTHPSTVGPSPNTVGSSTELPINPPSGSGSRMILYVSMIRLARASVFGSGVASGLAGLDPFLDVLEDATFYPLVTYSKHDRLCAFLNENVARSGPAPLQTVAAGFEVVPYLRVGDSHSFVP